MASPIDRSNPPLDTEAWDDMRFFTFTYPPKISSNGGYWGQNSINLYLLPLVEKKMIFIFFATQIIHLVLRRFGFSRITSEILAGLMMTINATQGGSGTFVEEVLGVIAKFNYVFFLFLMGVKMDISIIKNVDRKVCIFGSLIVLVPLLFGVSTTSHLTNRYHLSYNEHFALLIISAIHAMSLFGVIAYLVSELRILNSELGKLALSVATISDLISMFLYISVSSVKMSSSQDFFMSVKGIGYMVSYIIFLVFVVRPIASWVIEQTPEGSVVKETYIFLIVAMTFLFTGLFFLFDLNMFVAPYLLGLALPSGPPLGSTLETKYNSFIIHAFLPFFVSYCASNVNLWSIQLDKDIWKSATIILLVITVAKFCVCLVLAWYCKLPKKDAIALALILSSKGVMDIAHYSFAWELRIIPSRLYAISFVFIFVTSSIVPILVKNLYNPSRKYAGYKKRNLMDSSPNSELPILACIYRSENISPIIKLIDRCAVSKGKPVAVHALHLMRLTGQSTPIFICHGLHHRRISNYSSSKDVILSFKQLARNNPSILSLQAFTAISPPHLMHEDICTLALDKRASFIILPFHRTWTLDGQQIDDNSMRALNCSLLEKAPCSLGILVDRGHLGCRAYTIRQQTPSSHTYFNVAMIFLGGRDDREALTLAKHMARNQETILTVIHFKCNNDQEIMDNEHLLDLELLKDLKTDSCNKNIIYRDIWVDDGNHMIEVIRSFISSYKLVIVGRRYHEMSYHTAGLELWNDFPELGIIGDLLTTADFDAEFSILVVKQQIQIS